MAPFDPNPPSARDKRIARQPKGKPTARSKTSNRIEDRRGEPFVLDPLGWGDKFEPVQAAEYANRPLSPAGRQMMTPERNLGRSDQLNRNRGRQAPSYSTSMAANMNAYFNRLMAQPSPAQGDPIRYEDGSVGFEPGPPSRYGEIPYGDIGKTQQEFREAQRQAMLRSQARRILEGGQPSMSQMMTQGWMNERGYGNTRDIADMPVDPIYGQNDFTHPFPDQSYYKARNVPTLAAALAERRQGADSGKQLLGGPRQLSPEELRAYWQQRTGRPLTR